MTTFSPTPIRDDIALVGEPESRWRRLSRVPLRHKAATAAGLVVVLVAGVLGASYETAPGGALWGVEKTVFPGHAQDVALTAVVSDLKKAQDILGSGQQPTADQLTDARTALNQAKQDLDYLSSSPQQASLQNLYLQLTQQLLQYTPASAQQLAPLPAPPAEPQAADPGSASPSPDVALTSATAPTWGYQTPADGGSDSAVYSTSSDYVPPPADVPAAPDAGWPQPIAPPLTPNLQDLGYYDPSWGQLYGYNPGSWYNYDLSGYNQYGYDFLGFDRWGYDRSGYDRWGYDHWGYNWSGYNWSGYNRDGWDRDGRNEWGQRRDHPGDPRDQGWYDNHHPYQQYYDWKFQNVDPVYHRTQWDQAHGFNPNQYSNWNMNRDWKNPRNRDWAPPATSGAKPDTDVRIHNSSPVVNLNVSLAQFISNDKATATTGPLMKDLAGKSARDFTKDLDARTSTPAPSSAPASPAAPGKLPATPVGNHQTSLAPPALTAAVPTAPASKVSPGFAPPKLAPVPVNPPLTAGRQRPAPASTPGDSVPAVDPKPAPKADSPRVDSPNSAADPSAEPKQPTPPAPAVVVPKADAPKADTSKGDSPAPAVESPVVPKQTTVPDQAPAPAREDPAPRQANPVVQQPTSQEPERSVAPAKQEPPKRAAPDTPAPAPTTEAPAPRAQVRQAPVQQAPAPQAAAAPQPVRQAPPPVHEAPPPPAPKPAPQQRQEPAPQAPKCTTPKCPPAG